MKLRPATIVKIKSSTLYRWRSDGAIEVLNLESNQIYHLRDLAAYLWFQLDGSKTLVQVIEKSKKKFGIKNPQYSRLVKGFFDDVFLANLVQVLDEKLTPAAPLTCPLDEDSIDANLASLKLHLRPPEDIMAAAGGCGGCSACGACGGCS